MAAKTETRVACSELKGLLPKRGPAPDEVEVGNLTLTGAQAGRLAAVFVGDAKLTIRRLREGRIEARTSLTPPKIWWRFERDGTYSGQRRRTK